MADIKLTTGTSSTNMRESLDDETDRSRPANIIDLGSKRLLPPRPRPLKLTSTVLSPDMMTDPSILSLNQKVLADKSVLSQQSNADKPFEIPGTGWSLASNTPAAHKSVPKTKSVEYIEHVSKYPYLRNAYARRPEKYSSPYANCFGFNAEYEMKLQRGLAARRYAAEAKAETAGRPPESITSHVHSETTFADSGYASKSAGTVERRRSMNSNMVTEELTSTNLHPNFPTHTCASQSPDPGLYSAETVYSSSVASDLPATKSKAYVYKLAYTLAGKIDGSSLEESSLNRVLDVFPELLRTFALRVGCTATVQAHRDVAYFVHKYRSHITSCFEELCRPDEDLPKEFPSNSEESFTVGEYAISRFLQESEDLARISAEIDREDSRNVDNDVSSISDISDDDDHLDSKDGEFYHEIVENTTAFDWLLASIRTSAALRCGSPDTMADIRDNILQALPSMHKVSRHCVPRAYKMNINLDWNPLTFYQEQEYREDIVTALRHAITLTGTIGDAQALTTEAYFLQVWPKIGPFTLQLIFDFISNTTHGSSIELPDGTSMTASQHWFVNGNEGICVKVIGVANSIVEIAQQLAWLGAALRPSPSESLMAVSRPRIKAAAQANSTIQAKGGAHATCLVKFDVKPVASDSSALPGHCWVNMLRNPVIVEGFPTLERHEDSLGIEMPLNMIALLVGSERAHYFDSTVFIKGYSAMLVAVRACQDLLIWHYLFDKSNHHVSYLDGLRYSIENVDLAQLQTVRHVIGWSSECTYHTGDEEAQYDIDESGLPYSSAGASLENLTFIGGKEITSGSPVVLGLKDIPPHIKQSTYVSKLEWLDSRYLVLWDTVCQKGWLVNGTSALLHTVRLKLYSTSKGNFASQLMLNPKELAGDHDFMANSAVKALLEPGNRHLKVYSGGSKKSEKEVAQWSKGVCETSTTYNREKQYFLFEDLVEQYYESLEKLIELQYKAAGRNGVNLKRQFRKNLEGWDIVDIANGHEAYPRVAILHALGWGWVDFIRSIRATVLFGRGFGDLIRPVNSHNLCSEWRAVPDNKYYLVASVYDLQKIAKMHGNRWSQPPEIVHGLLWHSPEDLFSKCTCQAHALSTHMLEICKCRLNPVQILCPNTLGRSLAVTRPQDLSPSAGVIFGHNSSWKKRWKDNGADTELEDWTATEILDPELLHESGKFLTLPSNSTPLSVRVAGSSQSSMALGSLSSPPTSLSVRTMSPLDKHDSVGQLDQSSGSLNKQSPPPDDLHLQKGKKRRRAFLDLLERGCPDTRSNYRRKRVK